MERFGYIIASAIIGALLNATLELTSALGFRLQSNLLSSHSSAI
jgi:hypothetical protein